MPPSPTQITNYAALGLSQLTSQFSRSRIAPLVVTPNTLQTVVARGVLNFAVSGGSGSFSYSFVANNSGGTFAAGVYTAGPTGNVTDIVKVTDTVTGNSVQVSLSVWSPLNFGASVASWYNETLSVSTWTDDKGRANFTQGTGGNQPTTTTINGHPALHFAGDPHRMLGTVPTYNNAVTVWGVVKLSAFTTVSGQGAVLVGCNYFASAGLYVGADLNGNSGKLMFGHLATAGKFALSNASISDNTLHRYIGTWDGSTYKLYIDGVLQTTQGADSTSLFNLGDGFLYLAEVTSSSFGSTTGDIGQSGIRLATTAGSISNPGDDLYYLDHFLGVWGAQLTS